MNRRREDATVLERALQLAMRVDREHAIGFVAGLRRRYPKDSCDELAERIIRRSRWWAVGWGVATGLPSNPWVSLPGAVTDAGAMLRNEVQLAVRIALLYDPGFLDDNDPPYEVLVPIFGLRSAAEFAREMSILGTMGLTRAAIRSQLSKDTLAAFKRIMLKYFGLQVTQRSVVKATLPVVGAVVGGGWNYREFTTVGNCVKRYFKGLPIEEGGDPA